MSRYAYVLTDETCMKKRCALRRIVLGVGLILFLPAAWAEIVDEESKPWLEEKAEAWTEQKYVLPPYPREQDLVPLIASGLGLEHEYLIDLKSVSRTPDDVFHYTIVVSSSSGARNVFHEGIRCLGGMHVNAKALVKTYGFGSSSGQFRPVRADSWRKLRGKGVYLYRRALADEFFCDATMVHLDTRRLKLRFSEGDWSDGTASEGEMH